MGKPLEVAGVIPARWGSTRLPGKSLLPIGGRPLIHRVIERARRARRLDLLLVATDDARIAESVGALGVRAVMTRAEHPSGTDRVAEAVADVDARIVINIQGDEPLIDPALIDRLAEVLLEDADWDMATAAAPLGPDDDPANPSLVKVVTDRRGRALYFSRAVIPHVRDPGTAPEAALYRRHVGVYGYRKAFLERLTAAPPCVTERAEKLEQLRALDLGAAICVIETAEASIGIDTPEDVAYVEAMLRQGAGS